MDRLYFYSAVNIKALYCSQACSLFSFLLSLVCHPVVFEHVATGHNRWLMANSNSKILALFDVDGTLAPSRGIATPKILHLLQQLRQKIAVGIICGSTSRKICWQLDGVDARRTFDFVFAEGGLVACKYGVDLPFQSFVGFIGEEKYKELVGFILHYIADLDLPIKRGTFIEFRDGLINVCPMGRNSTTAEQDMFEQYDQVHGIRTKMINALKDAFPSYNLVCAIGGRTSFDLFPRGWDKTYALRHLEGEGFTEIHFFCDHPEPGGNDHELFHHPLVTGHKVEGPEETERLIRELFFSET